MNRPAFSVGDLVIVAPAYQRPTHRGVVYRITRILKVNIEAVPTTAGPRPIKGRPEIFQPAPTNTPANPTGIPDTTPPPTLHPGTVVTIAGPGWTQPPERLYTILRDNDRNVSAAVLGGDNGRYWRISRTMLTVVDPDRISITPQ